MKRATLVLAYFLLAGLAHGQTVRHYDITIRNLYTAEQQLLYEQKRTIGLHRHEIDRQLEKVRQQRLEIERLRAAAVQRSGSGASSRPRRSAAPPRQVVYRPPEPDWKTLETPHVLVKGTMMVDGRRGALVSGGQIVHSNQVFATKYQGETRWWRVTAIDDSGARFERVTESGAPYAEPVPQAPPAAEPDPPSDPEPWFNRLIQVLIRGPF